LFVIADRITTTVQEGGCRPKSLNEQPFGARLRRDVSSKKVDDRRVEDLGKISSSDMSVPAAPGLRRPKGDDLPPSLYGHYPAS
jgi:hypothetical protein